MQTRGNSEGESDLGWGGIDNYGADNGVGNYVLNNEKTNDYVDLGSAIGAEAYKAFGKEQVARKLQGRKRTNV